MNATAPELPPPLRDASMDAAAEFDAFYLAHDRDLVAMTYALTGDLRGATFPGFWVAGGRLYADARPHGRLVGLPARHRAGVPLA